MLKLQLQTSVKHVRKETLDKYVKMETRKETVTVHINHKIFLYLPRKKEKNILCTTG